MKEALIKARQALNLFLTDELRIEISFQPVKMIFHLIALRLARQVKQVRSLSRRQNALESVIPLKTSICLRAYYSSHWTPYVYFPPYLPPYICYA